MPEKAKSPIVIFIILILVSLSLGYVCFFLQKEKTNLSLQEELDSLNIKHNAAEIRLEEYKKTSQLDLTQRCPN